MFSSRVVAAPSASRTSNRSTMARCSRWEFRIRSLRAVKVNGGMLDHSVPSMRTRRRAPLASQVAAWNRALQSTVDLGGGVKGEGDHGVAAEFITLDEVLGVSRF